MLYGLNLRAIVGTYTMCIGSLSESVVSMCMTGHKSDIVAHSYTHRENVFNIFKLIITELSLIIYVLFPKKPAHTLPVSRVQAHPVLLSAPSDLPQGEGAAPVHSLSFTDSS